MDPTLQTGPVIPGGRLNTAAGDGPLKAGGSSYGAVTAQVPHE
jgi:hypothetical protein